MLQITTKENVRVRKEAMVKWNKKRMNEYIKHKKEQNWKQKNMGRATQGWIPVQVTAKINKYSQDMKLKDRERKKIFISITQTIMNTNRHMYRKWIEMNRNKRKSEGVNLEKMSNTMRLINVVNKMKFESRGIG